MPKLPKKKRCSRCHKLLPTTQFTKHRKKLRGYCKDCQRRENLFYAYGITPEDWERIFNSQKRKCPICHHTEKNVKIWTVDHDHATGKMRGILCDNCNKGLGHFRDDQDNFKRAIDYLNRDGLS